MQFFNDFMVAVWHLLEESSLYILLGLLVAGLLKVFLSPNYVATHLGKGKIKSVFKAALLGIPIPLCSCGVLPAAAQLKRQGEQWRHHGLSDFYPGVGRGFDRCLLGFA